MPRTEHEGVAIHFEVEGHGAPVVLHHGLADSLASFRRSGWVERLAARHRVILLDARGHGESDKPHDAASYASGPMVGDVLAVLDAVGEETAHFVGYSLGGRIGFELACVAPERLRSLIAGAAHPFAQSLRGARDAIGRGFVPWMQHFASIESELGAAIAAHFLRNDPEALAACAATDRPDRSAVLERFDRPALLFVGGEDSVAEEVMRAAFALPHGHLALFPGYDHFQLGLHIEAVLPAVEAFLERADQGMGAPSHATS
jgi:pimeloyl-ACP methyl ester carboxylesterase